MQDGKKYYSFIIIYDNTECHYHYKTHLTYFSDTKFKCMNMYRRSDDVLEIQEGTSTSVRGGAACDLMNDNMMSFVTLLSEYLLKIFCV